MGWCIDVAVLPVMLQARSGVLRFMAVGLVVAVYPRPSRFAGLIAANMVRNLTTMICNLSTAVSYLVVLSNT